MNQEPTKKQKRLLDIIYKEMILPRAELLEEQIVECHDGKLLKLGMLEAHQFENTDHFFGSLHYTVIDTGNGKKAHCVLRNEKLSGISIVHTDLTPKMSNELTHLQRITKRSFERPLPPKLPQKKPEYLFQVLEKSDAQIKAEEIQHLQDNIVEWVLEEDAEKKKKEAIQPALEGIAKDRVIKIMAEYVAAKNITIKDIEAETRLEAKEVKNLALTVELATEYRLGKITPSSNANQAAEPHTNLQAVAGQPADQEVHQHQPS